MLKLIAQRPRADITSHRARTKRARAFWLTDLRGGRGARLRRRFYLLLCARKRRYFCGENCAPKRPARFPASISHPRYLRQLETITRPFLTTARLYIPAVLSWSRIGRYCGQNEQYAQDFQNRFSKIERKTKKSNIYTTKNPGRKGRDCKSKKVL